MSERYDYGEWIESEPLGFNKRIVRYNAKQGRVTYAGITSTLSEFEEIWTKEMNDIQDFITKCNQQSICGVTNDN